MSDERSNPPSTPTRRLLRLTGMTTSIASRIAGHQVKKLFQSEEARVRSHEKLMRDVGHQIAETLGEMKGAVMKVGQIASQMQDLLPSEIADALSVLQKASAPMPFSIIRRQLRRQLGDEPDKLFASFDDVPFAAASIGQVHHATTTDGQNVVVKIQYPAVKSSIDSDMKQLRRILRLGALFKVDRATLDAIFHEIREQLEEELDYKKEAENIHRFREFHRNDPWLVIPKVIESLSSDQVLTMVYESGDDLENIAGDRRYTQATCNLLGERLFDAIRRQMFELREVHCDPHPGNFAFRPDGTLIMYDFGATKRIAEEDLSALRALMRAAYDSDYAALDSALHKLEVRKENSPGIDDAFYRQWLDILLPPFSNKPFNFNQSRLHIDLLKQTRNTPWRYLESFQPSPRTLLINRIFGGHYWTLVRLGVNTSFRQQVELALHD